MCNLYTWKMTAEEMRALKLHYQIHGTTWAEWEERQRQQNKPIDDVYPNKRAPVVVIENGEHVVRTCCGASRRPGSSTTGARIFVR
jgi:hypothetical protein